jgi:hypothetical protein
MFFNFDFADGAFGGAWYIERDGAQRRFGMTWLEGSNGEWVVAHEMGHGFGLPHSNNADGDSDPYDNPWDVMSSPAWGPPDPTYGRLPQHTNADYKWRLGWIPAAKALVPATSGTYDVPLTDMAAPDPDAYWTLRYRGRSGGMTTAEARTRQGFGAAQARAPAVVLYDVREGRNEWAWLIDKDVPPSDLGETEGPAWRQGETLRQPRSSVFDAGSRLEVLASTGSTMRLRLDYAAPIDLTAVEPLTPVTGSFGSSVDLEGDLLAVGQSRGPGAALYRRDSTQPNGWRHLTWVRPSATADDMVVSLDAERLAVGAWRDGRVGIFAPTAPGGDQWQQVAAIDDPEAAIGSFGARLALSGDHLVVAALDPRYQLAGVVHVFERQGSSWVRTARLLPTGANGTHRFGDALALQGDTLVVGSPYENDFAGAVYVYRRTAPGEGWLLERRFGDPGSGVIGSFVLGAQVALDGNRLAFLDPGGRRVYIFERPTASGSWVAAPGVKTTDYVRAGLALLGDLLAASDLDSVEVYQRDPAAASGWRLLASPAAQLAEAVAVSRAALAVGQPYDGGVPGYSGQVRLWNRFCVPTPTSLCSLGGRFEIRARWRTATATGEAQAVRLTDNTGYFWFFDAANVEVVVKTLDACTVAGANNFWVFAAGLTDQEVRLTVVDTWTSEVVDIVNPLSTGFGPSFETAAFRKSCGAPVGALSAQATGQSLHPPTTTPWLVAPAVVGTCTASPTALCLNNGRYRAEATWRTATASGTANTVTLTADTGYFWFFDPDNVEVVVKVLDACGVNDAHWVFASGLTDQEVRLEVTDTVTGAVRAWTNPRGNRFTPVRETNAFPHSCP